MKEGKKKGARGKEGGKYSKNKGNINYLEESMQQEGEPVCQHFFSNRLRPKHTRRGQRSGVCSGRTLIHQSIKYLLQQDLICLYINLIILI